MVRAHTLTLVCPMCGRFAGEVMGAAANTPGRWQYDSRGGPCYTCQQAAAAIERRRKKERREQAQAITIDRAEATHWRPPRPRRAPFTETIDPHPYTTAQAERLR